MAPWNGRLVEWIGLILCMVPASMTDFIVYEDALLLGCA